MCKCVCMTCMRACMRACVRACLRAHAYIYMYTCACIYIPIWAVGAKGRESCVVLCVVCCVLCAHLYLCVVFRAHNIIHTDTFVLCSVLSSVPSPTLSPTDPVPRGLLTLWATDGPGAQG
jgi:hypothetical protein